VAESLSLWFHPALLFGSPTFLIPSASPPCTGALRKRGRAGRKREPRRLSGAGFSDDPVKGLVIDDVLSSTIRDVVPVDDVPMRVDRA